MGVISEYIFFVGLCKTLREILNLGFNSSKPKKGTKRGGNVTMGEKCQKTQKFSFVSLHSSSDVSHWKKTGRSKTQTETLKNEKALTITQKLECKKQK